MFEIKKYPQITEEVKKIFQTFIPQNFDTVDFNNKETREEIEEWFWKPGQVYFTAYENDEVVGVCHITKRENNYHSSKISIACIGGLVVDKNHRKQGIATKLIAECFKQAKEWNVDISFLNTESYAFFEKFGFVRLKQNYSFIGKSGEIIEDDSGMIAPVNSKQVFEKVLKGEEVLFIGVGNL